MNRLPGHTWTYLDITGHTWTWGGLSQNDMQPKESCFTLVRLVFWLSGIQISLLGWWLWICIFYLKHSKTQWQQMALRLGDIQPWPSNLHGRHLDLEAKWPHSDHFDRFVWKWGIPNYTPKWLFPIVLICFNRETDD
jgi:hypothetical protein